MRKSGRAGPETRPDEGKRTLAEIASDAIRRDIVAGRLKPGERLLMEALRLRYGMGMSPLREALSGLAAEQLILFEGHRGFQVSPISVEDLRDLMETRKILEADVMRLVLIHGDDVWESDVIAAFHRLSKTEERIVAAKGRADPEWDERNAAFHAAISRACPLRWLKHVRAQMFEQAQRYRYFAWSILPEPAVIQAEHREIFEAAMARDEARLIAAMNVHIDTVARYVAELMEQKQS